MRPQQEEEWRWLASFRPEPDTESHDGRECWVCDGPVEPGFVFPCPALCRVALCSLKCVLKHRQGQCHSTRVCQRMEWQLPRFGERFAGPNTYNFLQAFLISSAGGKNLRVKGYEPNAIRVVRGAPMDRARSVPAKGSCGLDVNPFYSEKVQDELRLKAVRPHELPPSPTDLVAGISGGPTGQRPGKGRGGQPTGAGRGFYATPPSHLKSSEPKLSSASGRESD